MAKVCCLLLLYLTTALAGKLETLPACDSHIFCQGELLHAVQMGRLFSDSKYFVDMRLKYNASQVLQNFHALGPNRTREELSKFLDANFLKAGHDLVKWTPTDWQSKPKLINKIKDRNLKDFASALNELWKELGRNISAEARQNINRSSLIIVDNPFIVPGGRFREYYYWDSYWVVNGLLVCGMKETAKGMIDNFVQLVRTYGFVPNGGRIYYTNRSQPPFLIPIVELYLNFTNDQDYVKKILNVLEKEYDFWRQNRGVEVEITGRKYQLSIYAAAMNTPRPESYFEDYMTAKGVTDDTKRAALYRDIASAAESGWDFSTRWFNRTGPGAGKLGTTRTRQLIPVDLNSVLYRNEKILEKFCRMAGKDSEAEKYKTYAQNRRDAIEKVMWDEQIGLWLDYDRQLKERNPLFYASSVVPLWAGVHQGNETREKVVLDALKSLQVLYYPGGFPTSLNESGQQWDFPNAWPPLQHMLITGLAQSQNEEVQIGAFHIAEKWIRTNYESWKVTKHMFEKFNVTVQGASGGGGEYDIQKGFGWTNGVVLDLLHRYPDILEIKEHEESTTGSWTVTTSASSPKRSGMLCAGFVFISYYLASRF